MDEIYAHTQSDISSTNDKLIISSHIALQLLLLRLYSKQIEFEQKTNKNSKRKKKERKQKDKIDK